MNSSSGPACVIPRRRVLRPLAVAILILLFANVAAAAAQSAAPLAPLAVTSGVSDQLAWRPCPIPELPTRECGELVVPLNYREPQGATIALAVARVPATDPAGRLGSLFLNPGGPGQPGYE